MSEPDRGRTPPAAANLMASDVWAAARRDLARFAASLDDPHVVLRSGALLVISGGPAADFNMALLDAAPASERVLHEFVAAARAAGVPALFMLSGACARVLAEAARQEGLAPAGSAPLMLLTDPPAARHPPDRYEVEGVTEPGRLASVADLIASAFGLDRTWVGRTFAATAMLNAPGVHYFLATRDGQPWSTVTTTRTGSLVGIWSMATAPERQRRGAGRAVLEAALAAHRAQGVGAFYLVATPAGKPLYDALGFTTLDDLAIWVAGESAQFAIH